MPLLDKKLCNMYPLKTAIRLSLGLYGSKKIRPMYFGIDNNLAL